MNGKFLILLFMCLNIATLVGSSVCLETVDSCQFGNNFVLTLFISQNELNNFASDPSAIGGAGLDDEFSSSISNITKQSTTGSFVGGDAAVGFSILDGLKMILGLLALLTPIPLITFVASANLPIIFTIIFGIVPIVLYVLSIAEFIRGSSF